MSRHKFRIVMNSPVVLGFSLLCLVALVLNVVTKGMTNHLLFSVYRSSLMSPFTYIRMIGHVFGHAGWDHFLGNITLLLVIGPMLEEKYGSGNLCIIILATALLTGVVNFIFFPHVSLLGASGVVFAFILLASFTSIREGTIPMTFLLVALIYIGGQVYEGLFIRNNVANLTHILGGILGSAVGFRLNMKHRNSY